MTPTDGQLLERFAQRHDEAAFEALLARHGPMVLGVCRRVLRDAHEAEDAYQVTFLALARQASAIRRGNALANWLYEVAYRIAARLRSAALTRQQRTPQLAEVPEVTTSRGDPLAFVVWRELRPVLDEELSRLPHKYRAPLVLCYLEGKTNEDAARELGWPTGSMSKRLERGRELLRERLTRRGLALSGGLLFGALSESTATATVPAALALPTVQAASLFAARQSAVLSCVSAHVVALAEGVISVMVVSKIKLVASFCMVLALVLGGAGRLTYQALADRPAPPAQVEAKDKGDPPPQAKDKGDPPKDKKLAQDDKGEALPAGALARLGSLKDRPSGEFTSVAITPDGKMLAAAGPANPPTIWDLATGRQVRRLNTQKGTTHALAISPDARRLATATGDEKGLIDLWDLATGKQIARIQAQWGAIRSLAFSPDGKLFLSGGDDKIVDLYDAASGKKILRAAGHRAAIVSVAFSPDGKTAASGSLDGTVRLMDPFMGQVRLVLKPKAPVHAIAFSADGRTVAVAGGEPGKAGEVKLLDATTGKQVLQLPGQQGTAMSVAFTRDGSRLAVGHADGKIHLWGLPKGKAIRVLEGHQGGVQSLAFTPDGSNLVSGGKDNLLRLWEVETGKELYRLRGGHLGGIVAVGFVGDGKTAVTGSLDGKVRLWEAATGKEQKQIAIKHPGNLTGGALSRDGKVLATAGGDRLIHLWNLATGKEMNPCQGHTAAITSVAFAPDGQTLVSGSEDGTLRLWKTATGAELHKFVVQPGRTQATMLVAFSPDGKLLASVSQEGIIRLWNIARQKEMFKLSGPPRRILCLAFSPDGKTLVGGGSDKSVHLWETATGQERDVFENIPGGVLALAFKSDGRALALGSPDNSIRIWDVSAAKELCKFSGHEGGVCSLAFARDGKTLASGSFDGTALVWSLAGKVPAERPAGKGLTQKQVQDCWEALGKPDGIKAFQAINKMVLAPRESIAYVKDHLKPVSADDVEQKRLNLLVANLDSDRFKTREAASEELEKLGETVEPLLSQALAKKPTLEMRKRLERLLNKLDSPVTSAQRLRVLRAVEVLEHLATKESRQLLESYAKGAPGAGLTVEAQASLERLKGQTP
jgi:RNA polymerase sigma factor (sigma-70 family)